MKAQKPASTKTSGGSHQSPSAQSGKANSRGPGLKKPKQLTLFEELGMRTSRAREHGGGLHVGKRKEMRPLDRKKVIHVTMRSSKAKGELSFRAGRNFLFVSETLKAKALKFRVKIESWANVGNHLHLKVRIHSRGEFGQFLKSITGLIARFVTKARRGHPFGKFWDSLAYTRVLSSRQEELTLERYIELNQVEGEYGAWARADMEMDRANEAQEEKRRKRKGPGD